MTDKLTSERLDGLEARLPYYERYSRGIFLPPATVRELIAAARRVPCQRCYGTGYIDSDGLCGECDAGRIRLQRNQARVERDRLARRAEDAERWNHSVAVCREHTNEIIGTGCIVCERDRLARELEEARAWLHCHAGRDGDCVWPRCPQLRDGEPAATGRHCLLDRLANFIDPERGGI